MRTLAEMRRMEGRVAVVTGGAGHVGRAAAQALGELGAVVVIVDRDADACAARAAELSAAPVRVVGLAADLSADDAAERVIDRVIAAHQRLDVLVNNAAFTGDTQRSGWGVPFAEQTLAAWDAAMRVNVGAAFRLSQLAAPALAASGHGTIVNVASIYGVVGPDFSLYEGTAMANPAAYGASKGALLQLTRYLATTLAPRVRVNAISPGGIERGQPTLFQERYRQRTPLGRMGREEDLMGAIAYLASDLSAYVTGQNLAVDGGWTAW